MSAVAFNKIAEGLIEALAIVRASELPLSPSAAVEGTASTPKLAGIQSEGAGHPLKSAEDLAEALMDMGFRIVGR